MTNISNSLDVLVVNETMLDGVASGSGSTRDDGGRAAGPTSRVEVDPVRTLLFLAAAIIGAGAVGTMWLYNRQHARQSSRAGAEGGLGGSTCSNASTPGLLSMVMVSPGGSSAGYPPPLPLAYNARKHTLLLPGQFPATMSADVDGVVVGQSGGSLSLSLSGEGRGGCGSTGGGIGVSARGGTPGIGALVLRGPGTRTASGSVHPTASNTFATATATVRAGATYPYPGSMCAAANLALMVGRCIQDFDVINRDKALPSTNFVYKCWSDENA